MRLFIALLLRISGLLAVAMQMPMEVDESAICSDNNNNRGNETDDGKPQPGRCEYNPMKYENILDVQPGFQWINAGGYCGAWSIQRAALAKGAYLSAQKIRDSTSPGGGHDNEILSTNIDEALRNLKISYDWFDYENEPLPQLPAYFSWLKKQLSESNPVVWMILWADQPYPIYNLTPPAGMYGHVEPVIGIQSNYPLNNTQVYDDDVVLHYTDYGVRTVRRNLLSMEVKERDGNYASCGSSYRYCMGPYAFGWAVRGFIDSNIAALPAYLHIYPWTFEPDIRSGEPPMSVRGTLHVSGLTIGTFYDIYRWDSVDDAFTYDETFKKMTFRANDVDFVYEDDDEFPSDGTTYYRCVPSSSVLKITTTIDEATIVAK